MVVPAYTEAGVLERLCDEVFKALQGHRAEIVFVNDGSTDGSAAELDRLAAEGDPGRYVFPRPKLSDRTMISPLVGSRRRCAVVYAITRRSWRTGNGCGICVRGFRRRLWSCW